MGERHEDLLGDLFLHAFVACIGNDADDLGARAALGRILLSENRTADAMREYRALIDVLESRGLLGDEDKPE